MPPHLLEIATFNAASAITALGHGATRIELCSSRPDGGLTPTLSTLQEIRSSLLTYESYVSGSGSHNHHQPRIQIMIRTPPASPTSPFTCSQASFVTMKSSLQKFLSFCSPNNKNSNNQQQPLISGFVFGILTPSNSIDVELNTQLVDLICLHTSHTTPSSLQGEEFEIVFHRAFDVILEGIYSSSSSSLINNEADGGGGMRDGITQDRTHQRGGGEVDEEELDRAVERQILALASMGFTAILTSGGMHPLGAVGGVERLKRLVRIMRRLEEEEGGRGVKMKIIVGGGVRSGNIGMLRKETGAVAFHSAAVVDGDGDLVSAEEVVTLRELLNRS